MRASFWIQLLSIFSLTLSNPFIDIEHNLVRVLAQENMWTCELTWFFHQLSLRCLCSTRDALSIFLRELDF